MADANGSDEVSELPRGTVAFLFSDVEGSTQLLRKLREGYAPLIDEHRSLLREAFAAHGGRVVDSQADSFFVVFARVGDAVAAAAQAQRSFAAHAWPDGLEVRLRMGVHAGEPLVSEERYVGLGVHRAARICAAAHGGQVLLSQAAASLLAESEPRDVSTRDLGEHTLKDFERPERLYQLVIEGLPSKFPPLPTGKTDGRSKPWLEFRVLGPLEVVTDAGLLTIGGLRQRAVLAILLLRANEVVSTERIVDELWGEQPPRTATTSLQNAVVQLRKLLGPERLVTRPPGYLLKVEPEQLDLARFEGLVRRARAAEAPERAQLLRQALALWRGDPLADLASEEFVHAEIRRLEELRVSAVEDRVEADLELDRGEGIVAELESLVAQNPLRERLRGQLMLALYRAGRQAEALQAYHEARRTLVAELGIEPGPTLQQLHGAILRQERVLQPSGAATSPADHYTDVLKGLLASRLVPVLGPGVILSGRPEEAIWDETLATFLPGDAEVAAHLARVFECPPDLSGLARVSEYVAVTRGVGPLYDELHALFDRDYPPGPSHRLLASLPSLLRTRGLPCQLIVTSSYDATLERAFADAGEDLDVVAYVAYGRDRGRFLHVAADGSTRVVDQPNVETGITTDERTVLLKIHGGVDRDPRRERESFVVSEDDYIDYLAQSELASVMPVALAAKLRRSHFLFLGYALEEWSLRVFLRRLWGEERFSYRSWAVQPTPDPVAVEYWRQRGVDVFDVSLEQYVEELRKRVDDAVAREVPA